MDTGTIVAIAIVAGVVLLALLVMLPRLRSKAAERRDERERRGREQELGRRREAASEIHRTAADRELTDAQRLEHEADLRRTEAAKQSEQARMHDEGVADERLIREDEPDLAGHAAQERHRRPRT